MTTVVWSLPRAPTIGSRALQIKVGRPTILRTLAVLSELEASARLRDEPYYARSLPDTVRTSLGAGDRGLAARLAEGVEPLYPLHEQALITVRALLGEHRGEHAQAEELYAEAAERWKAWEMPWERAQSLLGQGRCLLALGRPGEATDALRSARETFARLGARPALEETDTLLLHATALTS